MTNIKNFKYYVFISNNSYYLVTYADLKNNSSVFCFNGFCSDFQNTLFKIHYSYKINRIIDLPGKGFWYKFIMPKQKHVTYDNQYFIFNESSRLSYFVPFLKKIKKDYPNAKLIFYFSNPPQNINIQRLQVVRQCYDTVITFCEDWLQDGWLLYQGIYSKVRIPDNDLPINDLFFVGSNKGRLDLLLRIYDRVTSLGLKCNFYISDVPKGKVKYRSGIVYNQYLPYPIVLQYIQKTSCILEVLEGSYSYASLRTFEAITYGKKLITTNLKISLNSFYNKNNMHCITTADDIELDWFVAELQPYKICPTQYSPNKFLEFISREV